MKNLTRKENIVLLSGANKGLGKALFDKLYNIDTIDLIVSISRNLSEEQQLLLDKKDDRFLFLQLDLAELSDRVPLQILERYQDSATKITFINNAGVIHPIGGIGKLNDKEIVNSIQVNVLAPVLITNFLLSVFSQQKIDVINISSGAANQVINGWSIYSSGKAYMKMFQESLQYQAEENPLINTYNIDPGIIDTDMQKNIREANTPDFTSHSDFVNYKEQGKLQNAKTVATRILKETKIL